MAEKGRDFGGDYFIDYDPMARSRSRSPIPMANKSPGKAPQQTLNEFWESLVCETPGKVTTIFPPSLYANLLPPAKPKPSSSSRNAAASYEDAAEECRAKVQRIKDECERTNEKFTDPEFDLETDGLHQNCLCGLEISGPPDVYPERRSPPPLGGRVLRDALSKLISSNILGRAPAATVDFRSLKEALGDDSERIYGPMPTSVHRVDWIFDEPQFTVDGFSTSDVEQGNNGNCWWVAAVATLCNMPGLIEKICVARDEECGVYGFVFYRDGEWISTVVDDSLYLCRADYSTECQEYDPTGEKERKHKQRFQTGSEALYFSKCKDPNETWLPLLEKAYAKVHGDYEAISGGTSGEAVEDLTGGVTTTLKTNKILRKKVLWEELMNANKEFIFAASAPSTGGTDSESRQGIALNHAYSVLKAVEEKGEDGKIVQLVLIRNPWGRRSVTGIGEWNGPWSDGSKEWTPYWMTKLNHRFGDDGEFWMSFNDFCHKFQILHRTRLFNKEFFVAQQWAAVHVSWVSGYLKTKFVVEIKREGQVVFVLSQLDDRYFRGLEGQYCFHLHFVVQKEGAEVGGYIVRARLSSMGQRSVSAEVYLEPGKYEVLPKIAAQRYPAKPQVWEVVRVAAENNPQKLRQIGLNYDISHAKGGIEDLEKEQKDKERSRRKKAEKRRADAERRRMDRDGSWAEAQHAAYVQGQQEGFAAARETFGGPNTHKDLGSKAEAQQKSPSQAQQAPKADLKEDGHLGENHIKSITRTESSLKERQPDDLGVTDNDTGETREGFKREEVEAVGNGKLETTADTKQERVNGKLDTTEDKNPEDAPEDKPEVKPEDDPEGGIDDKFSEDHDAKDEHLNAKSTARPAANPWNAVAVIGLRVYSKDPDVQVTLVKPKDSEEGAVLNVGGDIGAGATM